MLLYLFIKYIKLNTKSNLTDISLEDFSTKDALFLRTLRNELIQI